MQERLTMTTRELDRLRVVRQVLDRHVTWRQAAAQLGLSRRQMGYLCARVRTEGHRGMLHRLRGRPSNHQLKPGLLAEALALVKTRDPDFGPTFANEKLRQRHGLVLSTWTLRQDNTLQHAGRWYVLTEPWRTRRPKQVTIVETFEGQRLICHGAQVLASRAIAPRPPATAPRFPWPSRHRAVVIPEADHPWRSESFLRSRRARELRQAQARGIALNHNHHKEDSSTLQKRGHF